jgi:hypothetical protein
MQTIYIDKNEYEQIESFVQFMQCLNNHISDIDDTDEISIFFRHSDMGIANYKGGIKGKKFNCNVGRLQSVGTKWLLTYNGGFKDGVFDGHAKVEYYGKDKFELSSKISDWQCDTFSNDWVYEGNLKNGSFNGDGKVISQYLEYPHYLTQLIFKNVNILYFLPPQEYECFYDDDGLCIKCEYLPESDTKLSYYHLPIVNCDDINDDYKQNIDINKDENGKCSYVSHQMHTNAQHIIRIKGDSYCCYLPINSFEKYSNVDNVTCCTYDENGACNNEQHIKIIKDHFRYC